ncbi:family 43 glycosylhydrolase [Chryseolinea sp. T2]|uniref:family 43 glycosylhydrolase n=1 Tax=Chryseolinea sp. T2 TaxID=3129255 RepID=UPI0030770821
MKVIITLAISLSLLVSCTNRSKEIAQQQVIAGELPDPSIIKVNDTYYAAGSSNDWGPVYPVYKSSNLTDWSFVNFVFSEPPSWTVGSYWAPELFYREGTFYCYYTARRKDGISCIGVATTKNIEEGFQDRGMILEWGNEAIDAFVFDEDSTLYITWKANGLTHGKTIEIMGAALTSDGLAVQGEPFVMLTAGKDSWENGGMEGQCIVKKDNYLYMLYSGNSCCGGSCNYQVGVARSRTMRGPWQKYDGNPLIKGNADWKCPGHGTALSTGDQWYYLYHAYNKSGFPYLGRTTLLSEMFWDGDSGWPRFNTEARDSSSAVLKDNVMDSFDSVAISPRWRFNIPAYTIKTAINNGKLTIAEVLRKGPAGSAICISPDDADFTMTTKITEHNGALKGIVLYATADNALGMGVKGDSLVLWKVRDRQFVLLNKLSVDSAKDVFLKADIEQAHIGTFSYSQDGKNWSPVSNTQTGDKSIIGDNLAWWSWGVKAGLMVGTDSISGDNTATFDDFTLVYK